MHSPTPTRSLIFLPECGSTQCRVVAMRRISMSPNTGLPLCTPGTHHSSGSKLQLAAGRPPRLAGWPREWRQRQEGSGRTSLRTAASGGQDPFSGRSPLFESEIFNKEMME